MTNTPSVNPSNLNSLPGVFREVLGKFLQNIDDMLPARVIAYDRVNKRVTVQPMILVMRTDGAPVERAQVASIPVLQMGGGNFVMDINLVPGDLGWIKANDRDISLFLQKYTTSTPNTFRKHSFEDAIFIPAAMTGYSINAEDVDCCVLQTLDGTQRISIGADRIKITSTNEIILDAPLLTITGDITGDGTRATGNGTFNGTLKANVDVLAGANDISLVTHVHINSGGIGDGGPPKP